MSFVAAAGLGVAAYGAYNQYEQGQNMQDAQNRALAAARTTLGGFSGSSNVNMPQVRMDPEGAGFHINYDSDSQRVLGNSGSYADRLTAMLGQGSLNPMTLGIAGPMGLDAIFGRSTAAGNGAYTDMLRQLNTGFQRPLQNTAFRGAGMQLQDAMMGGDAARMRTLDLLRSQAAPMESRAMDDLQNRQFSMGQLGTSGGAMQTEAFARGLAQADTDRQLQAAQEGRNFQNNAMGLAQGAAGMGTGLRNTEAQLLQDAFGRFGTLQGMNADLNNQRFQRSMYGLQFPMQMDQLRFGNINAALGIRSGLQEQGLQMFQAGLGAAQAGANARIGSGSNIAGIVGSPNFGLGGAMQANTISQFGSAMMGGQSASDILGRIFTPSSATSPANLQPGLNYGINQGIGQTMANNEASLMAFRPVGY